MNTPGWSVGLIALAAVIYLLSALIAETPRPGSPLPAPPLPGWLSSPRDRGGVGAVVVASLVVVVLGAVAVREPVYVPAALLLILGVPAAYTDARELRLPDELTYTLAAATTVAVVALQVTGVGDGVLRAVLSGAGYALALLLFAVLAPTGRTVATEAGSIRAATPAALGLGDIKLAVGVGVVLGWTSATVLIGAVFLTAAGHLLWLIGCTPARRAGRSYGMTATARGPWIVGGAAAALSLSLPPR